MLAPSTNEAVISVRDVVVVLNNHAVLNQLSLDVFRGEVLGFVGGSGSCSAPLSGRRTRINGVPLNADGAFCFSKVRCFPR